MQVSEKEEFRNYLEKSGIIDALTKVLVGLYEEHEKPVDALEWMKSHLGSVASFEVDALKKENEELRKKNAELQQSLEDLSQKVRYASFVRIKSSYIPLFRISFKA